MNAETVHGIIARRAELCYDKTAFTERDGSVRSFGDLLLDARNFGASLCQKGLAGRPAALLGEITYGTVAAMLGSLLAGCPLVPLNQGLSVDELRALLTEYEIGALIYSPGCAETAWTLAGRLPELTALGDVAASAELTEVEFPPDDPFSPAFLFSSDGGGALLSHKNICEALEAVASLKDIGSYTFLAPAAWGDAFDCVMGLLLPLSAGCGLIRRGEKRGTVKTVSESGASALTCTPQRLRGFERSLRHLCEKRGGGPFSKLLSLLSGLLSRDVGRRMNRRVRELLGNDLKLMICGGPWPERACARQFTEYGLEVLSLWFTPECGPLAVYDPAAKKLTPIAPLSVPSPIKGGLGELCLTGERVPIGYFGGRTDFDGSFPTGDVGAVAEDGSLELRGRHRTMLYGKDGEMVFPEEIADVIRRCPYVSDCTVTGRFDTKTADVMITARLTPDHRALGRALGEKYSPNRLKLFFNREMEKLADALPHKVHEFILPD